MIRSQSHSKIYDDEELPRGTMRGIHTRILMSGDGQLDSLVEFLEENDLSVDIGDLVCSLCGRNDIQFVTDIKQTKRHSGAPKKSTLRGFMQYSDEAHQFYEGLRDMRVKHPEMFD